MSSIILALLAATTVYRLELTNNKPYIVGEDGVKREVCLVDPSEYALMTGQVAKVWASLHASEDSRVKLHGRRKAQEIDAKRGTKTSVYDDGYRHVERFERRNQKPKVESRAVSPNTRTMSERHEDMKRRIEAAKRQKPITVTLEHDAATGKEIVK